LGVKAGGTYSNHCDVKSTKYSLLTQGKTPPPPPPRTHLLTRSARPTPCITFLAISLPRTSKSSNCLLLVRLPHLCVPFLLSLCLASQLMTQYRGIFILQHSKIAFIHFNEAPLTLNSHSPSFAFTHYPTSNLSKPLVHNRCCGNRFQVISGYII
jgi:hypothetical protein